MDLGNEWRKSKINSMIESIANNHGIYILAQFSGIYFDPIICFCTSLAEKLSNREKEKQ